MKLNEISLAIILISMGLGACVMAESTRTINAKKIEAPQEETQKTKVIANRNLVIKTTSEWIKQQFRDNEDFNAERDLHLHTKRELLSREIMTALKQKITAEQRAELMLRLGRLSIEDYYYEMSVAYAIHDAQLKEYDAKFKNSKMPPPQLQSSKANRRLEQAETVFRALIKQYPTHAQRDQILYSYSVVLLNKNELDLAMKNFVELTEKFPKSKYTYNAIAQLGDYHFEASRFPEAETYYQKLIDAKYSPLVSYAVYRKGWCAYNTQRTELALMSFRWVIFNEDKLADKATYKVRGEALQDITLPLADLRQVGASIQFFSGFEPATQRRGIETIASLSAERGNYDDAIRLWDHLLRLDPNHAKAPEYDLKVVDAYRLSNRHSAAIERLLAKFPQYLGNSAWQTIHAGNKALLKETETKLEIGTRGYALYFHSIGQSAEHDEELKMARVIYTRYLELFSDSEDAPVLRNHLANILFKQKEFSAASEQYILVAKTSKDATLRQQSVENALSSLDQQINVERKATGQVELKAGKYDKVAARANAPMDADPYTSTESRFIKLGDFYVDKYSETKDAPVILHRVGYLQYIHFDFKSAFKTFKSFTKQFKGHTETVQVSYHMLDILNHWADFEGIVSLSKELLANGPKDMTFRTNVSDVLRKAELQVIAAIEEKQEYEKAALAYRDYTKQYGHQDKVLYEKALHNAAINFEKSGRFADAVQTKEVFLDIFPQSQLKTQFILEIATHYEQMGGLAKAAQYYETYYQLEPKSKQALSALRLSALYRWALKDNRKAEALLWKAHKAFPSQAKALEADLMDLYESEGSTSKMISLHQSAIDQPSMSAGEKVARMMKVAELKSHRKGLFLPVATMAVLEEAEKNLKGIQRHPAAVEAAAKIKLWDIRNREIQFQRLSFGTNPDAMDRVFKKKIALLSELEGAYAAQSKMGNAEWGLGGIYRTASLYHQLASEMIASPVPKSLSGASIETYRTEVRKLTEPFMSKALNLASSCLRSSEKHQILSPWTGKCYDLASKIDAKQYPKIRTFYLPSVQVATMIGNETLSKWEKGSVLESAYPISTKEFFFPSYPERSLAMTPVNQTLGYTDSTDNDILENGNSTPKPFDYQIVRKEWKEKLSSYIDSRKPSNPKKPGTLSYLNALRLAQPEQAQAQILQALQLAPNDAALTNLLALAYLDQSNLVAARVTWLAMLARGLKSGSVLNNLGVLSVQLGNEDLAISYFKRAMEHSDHTEAASNLGYLALKYRNGTEADRHFGQALKADASHLPSQVGMSVAKIQSADYMTAKQDLINLVSKAPQDPYVRLTVGYLLMDALGDHEAATQNFTQFLNQRTPDESQILFQRALQESMRTPSSLDQATSLGQAKNE